MRYPVYQRVILPFDVDWNNFLHFNLEPEWPHLLAPRHWHWHWRLKWFTMSLTLSECLLKPRSPYSSSFTVDWNWNPLIRPHHRVSQLLRVTRCLPIHLLHQICKLQSLHFEPYSFNHASSFVILSKISFSVMKEVSFKCCGTLCRATEYDNRVTSPTSFSVIIFLW